MKRPPLKDIVGRAPLIGQSAQDFRDMLEYIYHLEKELQTATQFIGELDQTVIRLRSTIEKVKEICKSSDK